MSVPRPIALSVASIGLYVLWAAPALIAASKARPPRVVFLEEDGRLGYDCDEHGNRVPDFSHCGYGGGNRAIPVAPIRVVVSPMSGDATERIQRAIDTVAGLPPDTEGLRGAVLLLQGRHEIAGGLRLITSGVVLRGQGTAWEGLSRYDLTNFNPWYWTRLRQFADICDRRGLVLLNQNYFQHNILEAGAHWADSPWRTANNINHTDFPEPPPYAGDKRIFQAELFYDVTHPGRRKLHEGYIRQCLDNFTNQVNVIQFTSAEFTGSLRFMEFWLDTVAEWERETGRDALVALSCTKDVQDTILADVRRNAVVDILDFRYWWRTEKGEFAPPGGKNLAPGQFERRWRGGRPNDVHLAAMGVEYRAKFPSRPLICDLETAGWAWVCAGGSMPRLPKATDAELLAAIPRMGVWVEASKDGCWALHEPGKQMLVYAGAELDLSGEVGTFRLRVVNPRTGQVSSDETVKAGGRVKLPTTPVVWLTKD